MRRLVSFLIATATVARAEPFLVVPALPLTASPGSEASAIRAAEMAPPAGAELLLAGRGWGVGVERGGEGTDIRGALLAMVVPVPATDERVALTVGQWGTDFYREQRLVLALRAPGASDWWVSGVAVEARRVSLSDHGGRSGVGLGAFAAGAAGGVSAVASLYPMAVVGERALHPPRWGLVLAGSTGGMSGGVGVGGTGSALDTRLIASTGGDGWGGAAELDLSTGALRMGLGLGGSSGPAGLFTLSMQRDLGVSTGLAAVGGRR
jgi:hypothetical protein